MNQMEKQEIEFDVVDDSKSRSKNISELQIEDH